ncbi:MAG: hypothetical protein IJM61_04380 [Firmicutes bacterium]|nr:hypothetical protein [Bacillota bacterium]
MLKKLGKWNLLIIAIILGLILSLINFLAVNPSKEYADAGFVLLYSGAEKGEAPNGQSFSVDVIKSEDFLKEVLDKAGLSDKITSAELAENMTVRGSYPANIIEQIKSWDSLLTSDPTRVVSLSDYYPTTFNISIVNEFKNKLSKTQLTGLLNTLVEEYKTKYQKIYGAGVEWDKLGDVFATESRDYAQAVDLLSVKCDLVDKHSQALYEVKQTFENDGVTFLTLSTRAKSIMSNDLQSLSAMITLDALSKDTEALRQKYVYEDDIQIRKLNALTKELEEVEKLIDGYEKDATLYLGSGDSVIEVKGNSKETYEKLVDEKTRLSAELNEARIAINDIESRIADIDANADGTSIDGSVLEKAIAAASKKIDALIADFDALAKAYDEEYASTSSIRSSSAVYHGNRLLSGSFIKALIKSEAPLCAIALIVILAIGLVAETRKNGKKARRIAKSRKAA